MLHRGSGDGLAPVLLASAKDASPASLERLEHEYALRAELDASWAARPIALTRYNDRGTLVLEDPGGEPLDRLLDGPLRAGEFLHLAIPLTNALHQMHARGLIHKNIKPGNIRSHSRVQPQRLERAQPDRRAVCDRRDPRASRRRLPFA
jgi:serine/threonine protein kinase